jgi:predicted nucleic acid-binding protein
VTDAVLDASVFVAAISPTEVHHKSARKLYLSHLADRPFIVPSLFRIEVISALARRGESSELIDTVDVLVSGPRFHCVALDAPLVEQAARVARTARLRAYDSVYVALALGRGAALYTLDAEARTKIAQAFPRLKVVGSPGRSG